MRLHSQVIQIGHDYTREGGHVKMYFLDGEQKTIIDTGVEASPEDVIAPYLAYYGYKLEDVELVLNTHGHFDHAGGNLSFPRAEICMHGADAFLVEDAEKCFDGFFRAFLRLSSESRIAAERSKRVASFKRQEVARRLKDGDVIELGKGISLKVVHLPGHSMGSVGFLWEKEGMLFTGDSVLGQGSTPGGLPTVFHPLVYAQTLKRLLDMPIGTLACGHHYESLRCPANPIKKGQLVRTYLQDCQEINDRILDAVGRAIRQHWQAPLPVILGAAVEQLSQRLYLRLAPPLGFPVAALTTLGAAYDDIMGSL